MSLSLVFFKTIRAVAFFSLRLTAVEIRLDGFLCIVKANAAGKVIVIANHESGNSQSASGPNGSQLH